MVDKVETEVAMEVSVKQDFSEELKDNTSKAYKDFSKSFMDQMKKIYENVPEYDGVEIRSLRAGSIVVDYIVLLKLPFSTDLNEKYEEMKNSLEETLKTVSNNSDSCQENETLCFNPDSVKVDNSTRPPDFKALCRRIAPEGYENLYYPLVEDGKLRCVTNCTSGLPNTVNCNFGQCILEKSGPTCRCYSSPSHWYSGPYCEVAVPWRSLVGGLAGAGAVLLLLLGAAVSYYVVRRRRRDEGRPEDYNSSWFDVCDENSVGTFTNLGFEDEQTVKEGNFQVNLNTVDPNAKVHIERPETVSSWL